MTFCETKAMSKRIRLCVASLTGLIVIVSAGYLYVSVFSLRRSLAYRARSVAPLVDGAYEYRSQHGCWPDQLTDLVPNYIDTLPGREWQYYYLPPPEDVAELRWQGRMHTKLGYVFEPSMDSASDKGWYASTEGNPISLPRISDADN